MEEKQDRKTWLKNYKKQNLAMRSRAYDAMVWKNVQGTGKPYCGWYGIHNPLKLNISDDTITKLKG